MPSSLFGSPARVPQTTASKAAGGLNMQNLQSIKRMMGMCRATKNPGAIMEAMAQQNPMIKNIMQVCSPGGLQNSFYQLCREQGVNPDDVLKQIM